MNDILDAITESNGGYFKAAHALDCGYRSRDLTRAVRQGAIRRVRHGTYAFAEFWDSLTLEARHTVLLKSVVREANGAVAACSVSACALRGFNLWDHDLSKVHVVRLDGGASRSEAGVIHHRADLGADDIEIVDGIPAVRADLAVCQAGSLASLEAGIVLYDSALRTKSTSKEELTCRAAALEHHPRTRHVRLGVGLSDGRAESPGESRNRFLFFRYNVPSPELQYRVHKKDGKLLGISDFAWPLYCHLGEFDGLMKYQRSLNGDKAPEQVVTDEKLREDAMRQEGHGMTRTIWAQLDARRARETALQTLAGLEDSRKRYTKNRVTIA